MFWKKKKKRNEKIELTEKGFLVNCDEEISQFEWSEIEKLTGFLFGRITYDDVCLRIESENKTSIISEEFVGWRNFMNELYKQFPELNKKWERIMYNPPFERKETELYNRNKNFAIVGVFHHQQSTYSNILYPHFWRKTPKVAEK